MNMLSCCLSIAEKYYSIISLGWTQSNFIELTNAKLAIFISNLILTQIVLHLELKQCNTLDITGQIN